MKRNNRTLMPVVVLLFVVVASMVFSILNQGQQQEALRISVIVDDSSGNRWTAFREGVEEAAGDYGIRLSYVATGQFGGIRQELSAVEKALEAGADGVVVQMYASEGVYEELESLLGRENCVLLETDISPEEYYQTVGPDNRELGRALAARIREDFGGNLEGRTVGILCGNTGQLAVRQRLEGFEEELEGSGASVLWRLAEMGTSPDDEAFAACWEQGADIVAALENRETERAVDYLETAGGGADCSLYGVGSSEKVVYYLDKGVIRALAAPDEFSMGYKSMEELAWKLEYHVQERSSVRTGYVVVDREHLYDEENQKILFPIVQ
ncbi:MAG: substrate-binding domain-containing protein [Eubacteriales bacterium]|nr:substrate-binding domain-containing protein [Eubacteriales bacterium]